MIAMAICGATGIENMFSPEIFEGEGRVKLRSKSDSIQPFNASSALARASLRVAPYVMTFSRSGKVTNNLYDACQGGNWGSAQRRKGYDQASKEHGLPLV